MQGRSPKLLEQHAPYAKLLLRATHQLMKQPQYTYEGPAYRSPPILLQLLVALLLFTRLPLPSQGPENRAERGAEAEVRHVLHRHP